MADPAPDGVVHVVLVGMMGAGKSSVGALLARSLGRPFLDTDAELAARHGRPAGTLLAEVGEEEFRRAETAVLADVLGRTTPLVVAAGGGAVVTAACRALLARHTVVWLRATPATLAGRVGRGAGRPLLAGDPGGALERLASARADWYAEVATVTVDTDGRPATTVARDVEKALGAGGAA